MGRKTVFIAVLLLAAGSAFALNVGIAQLDASRLLLTQTVAAYVSVTDDAGVPVQGLTQDVFSIAESSDGQRFSTPLRIEGFTSEAGAKEGITFLLLIDDSGSMYDALDGKKTTDDSLMRVTFAKAAVRTFLESMTSPADSVGLVSYNTFYTRLAPPGKDRQRITTLLEGIARPTTDQAYTELYASLTLAVKEFAGISGRKAIIILSDGENFPFAEHSGKPHPVFGTSVHKYTDSILACQEEGITVYAVNFALGAKDRNLSEIAVQTGGRMFDAANGEELAGVYASIHRQVAGEYRVDYRATIAPAEKQYVRVSVQGMGPETSSSRFYFASTVFGLPMPALSPLLAVPLVLAGLLLWLLTLLKLERKGGLASLEVIQTQVGRPVTRMLPLTGTKTVIGGARSADLTIVGAPQVKSEHATIIFDKKADSYTVVGGGGDIKVNNQPVKTRVLKPGDVIDVGGATIVFDDSKK
jgi:Ca-activated chloride channel family protein